MTFTSLAFAAFVIVTILIYFFPPLRHYQWTILLIRMFDT